MTRASPSPFEIGRLAVSLLLAVVAAGCGSASHPGAMAVDASSSDVVSDAAGKTKEAGVDSAGGSTSDGPPSRTSSCTPLTAQTGTAINTSFGRLDGTLAFVVPQGGSKECNGDDSHVHLQIRVNGDIYDVAVDIGSSPGDVSLYQENVALPDGAWSEGWHGTDTLTYTALGIHSGQFTAQDPAPLSSSLVADLAQVNHVSIFGTGYNTDNGCHDVHYHNGDGTDGALFLEPLSPKAQGMFFRFKTDSF